MKTLDQTYQIVQNNPEAITSIPYTEFIALINQTNVPPGAYTTISEWLAFGHINATSRIMELACTTGFSVTELSRQTGAYGLGIDICDQSIERAKMNASRQNLSQLEFAIANAHQANKLLKDKHITHVVIGASLRFIDNASKTPFFATLFAGHTERLSLLSCEFFAKKDIPKKLLKDAEDVFGIIPTNISYKEVMRPYASLLKTYEVERDLKPETSEELNFYCQSTIDRFAAERSLNASSDELCKLAYKRLYDIKDMSNRLRTYQSYVNLIHEYSPAEFGRRFTELF